jgi:hypothetical protein
MNAKGYPSAAADQSRRRAPAHKNQLRHRRVDGLHGFDQSIRDEP